MFCPDFCCLLKDFLADNRLVCVGDYNTPIIRNGGGLPGFVISDLCFQQDQIAGVDWVA